jgi:hypothetical protein
MCTSPRAHPQWPCRRAAEQHDELAPLDMLPQSEDHTLPHRLEKAALCITAKSAADGRDGSKPVMLRTSNCFPVCPRLRTFSHNSFTRNKPEVIARTKRPDSNRSLKLEVHTAAPGRRFALVTVDSV